MNNPVNWFILFLCTAVVGLYLILPQPRQTVTHDPVTGKEKKTVTLVFGGLGRDRLVMNEVKEKFEAAHPDMAIKFIRTFSPRKVETMIAAGIAPDVLIVPYDKVPYYREAGAILDITSFVTNDPELYADLKEGGDFYDVLVEPFHVEGKIDMLPLWYTPFILYYNKDLFDKNGVAYPDETWTWEDMRAAAKKMTHDTDNDGKIDEFGLYFAQWQHGIETFIFQNGGRILNEDGTRVDMTDPKTIEALQFLYDLKFKDKVCPSNFLTPGVSPSRLFRQGKIAIFGPWGVFSMVDFKTEITSFDWDVAVLPKGPTGKRASLVAPAALAVSSQSPHPEVSYEFIRFMTSKEGMEIIAKWGLFLPCRKSVARSPALCNPHELPENDAALIHDVENGYAHLPAYTSTRYGDVYDVINEETYRMLDMKYSTPAETTSNITTKANRILARVQPMQKPLSDIPVILWLPLIIIFVCGVTGLIVWFRKTGRAMGRASRIEERWGYILISPWLIGFCLLTAGPLLVSIFLSFCQWQSLSSIGSAAFVGVSNYVRALSGLDDKFYPSLYATLKYTAFAVPIGLTAALFLALLLNRKIRGVTIFRTLYFLPAVLPSVAVTILWWYLFNTESGWINHLLAFIGIPSINWLGDPRFAIFIFVFMHLWAVGGGIIIYLAALQGVPTELYEAAEIDGAGHWSRFRHVTLPMISPVIFFNLVMGIIGSFQVFNQAFIMFDGGGGPDDSTLFYVLHLYNEAITHYRFGYGAALAWILFVIILICTLLIFKSSSLWVYYEGAKRKGRA